MSKFGFYSREKALIVTALFAAIICAGWMMTIPVGPVPIVLQNALAILSGVLLGPLYGGLAVLLFLCLGALGLPVFAKGNAGLATLLGPTGGFLFGYLLGAVVAGLIVRLWYKENYVNWYVIIILSVATLAGFVAIYIPGLPVLKAVLNFSWEKTFAVGLFPFLIADGIKIVVVILVGFASLPVLNRYLNR